MGGLLLLLTLIAIYIVVYWFMAAENSSVGKHFGFLGLLTAEELKLMEATKQEKQRQRYMSVRPSNPEPAIVLQEGQPKRRRPPRIMRRSSV